jgi:hypothetical protein
MTLTFSGSYQGKPWLPSEEAATRRVQRFLDGLTLAVGRPVDGLAGIEHGRRTGRIHAEVVLNIQAPYRGCLHAASNEWERRDGNGHVGKSRAIIGGGERLQTVRYVVKYVTKGGNLVFSRTMGPVRILGVEFADPGLGERPEAPCTV